MRWLFPLALTSVAGCAALAGLEGDYTVGAGGAAAGSATGAGTRTGTTTGTAGSGGSPTAGGGTGGTSTGGIGGAGTGGGTGLGGAGGAIEPGCGNNVHEPPGEECDDGNKDHLDGCSATCTIEDPDSCTAAPIILLSRPGSEAVTGDTTGANDDITTSTSTLKCGAGTRLGPDHVWIVIPQASGNLTATLDANFDYHFLHMRTACPGSIDIGCDFDASAGTDDDFVVPVVQGLTYYVIVDGWQSTPGGSYTLTVRLD